MMKINRKARRAQRAMARGGVARQKTPIRAQVSDRSAVVAAGTTDGPSPDDEVWCRYLEILAYRTPLEVLRHPAGWVIVQCRGGSYEVCDGIFPTREEARTVMEEWQSCRQMLDATAAELRGPAAQPAS